MSADMTERGSVAVQVWVDGTEVHETPVLRVKEEPRWVAVRVAGAKEVRIVGTDAGDGIAADHVNLGDLRFSSSEEEPEPGLPRPVSFEGDAPAPDAPWSLWFRRPAVRWLEAVPLGNGRLGAMVFGGVPEERLALNESTVWSGASSSSNVSPDARAHLDEIRRLSLEGRHVEARDLCARHLLGRKESYGTHLPMADLWIEMRHDPDTGRSAGSPRGAGTSDAELSRDMRPEGSKAILEGGAAVRDYRRWLDLDEGVARVEYSVGGTRYAREAFASHPARVVALRLSADRPAAVSFSARLDGGRLPCESRAADPRTLALRGRAVESIHSDGRSGVELETRVRAVARGGEVRATRDTLEVRGADEVVLLIAAGTTYRGGDPAALCEEPLDAAAARPWEELRRSHLEDHRPLFRRVAIDLGGAGPDEPRGAVPTDVRRAALRADRGDSGLEALFFQYGRYLLIAGSRADSPLPTNLQGIWNDGLACSMGWTCDFHLDINTQQNYWPAEVCNLSECHEPLFRLIESLVEPGGRTARDLYGAPGWVCHVFTNAWGYTAPGWGLGWGLHPTGGIWIASHLWHRWEFTGDREFLERRAYPVLRGAARFFLGYMAEDPRHGWLVTGPSVSPENAFLTPDGHAVSEAMGPTCDSVLVRDLFRSCVEASRVLGVDADLRSDLEAAVERLPPLRVGRHGQLMEWLEDHEEAVPNHRHTSHLIALYPSAQITPRTTPELARAARVSIERRIGRPDWEDVEWSRGNLVVYFARLGDGEAARAHLVGLLSEDSDASLLTFSRGGIAGAPENIFSIDGNYAGAAGIAEMLLQSHDGAIDLLPALPRGWERGSVRGLRARGGFEVDIDWRDGALTGAAVRAIRGGACTLRWRDRKAEFAIEAGAERRLGGDLSVR